MHWLSFPFGSLSLQLSPSPSVAIESLESPSSPGLVAGLSLTLRRWRSRGARAAPPSDPRARGEYFWPGQSRFAKLRGRSSGRHLSNRILARAGWLCLQLSLRKQHLRVGRTADAAIYEHTRTNIQMMRSEAADPHFPCLSCTAGWKHLSNAAWTAAPCISLNVVAFFKSRESASKSLNHCDPVRLFRYGNAIEPVRCMYVKLLVPLVYTGLVACITM